MNKFNKNPKRKWKTKIVQEKIEEILRLLLSSLLYIADREYGKLFVINGIHTKKKEKS